MTAIRTKPVTLLLLRIGELSTTRLPRSRPLADALTMLKRSKVAAWTNRALLL
jgi:hypothetical protein